MIKEVRNPVITIQEEKVLSDNWYTLKKITFAYQHKNGKRETQSREAYDRGNGATILLYNLQKQTIILTRQFRMPTYINGNPTGMLIEACAGLLDQDQPEVAIRREAEEETGFKVREVQKVFEAYMSPGSVTERLFFYIAQYEESDRITSGGGVEDEDIEVLEIPFSEAVQMVAGGEIIDGKTIMLIQYLQLHKILES
ncbi:GDP-mannose pyrophosphatase NudK [Rhodocytophaga aerolata]|uniref:GDP-mannose pyrophosphatase n=1 Tax=Rhodocytophaga aerolata TaxID=455078 RepID=A0ABT8R376_9BACT|nr:GDP-mannose pyrophosphatase NudK [Rhodocytophaga aerolata]MDO1445648.1 GDP-mannose pyrophosphatase NudK [Rhodocytophaga aerolata]